MKKSSKTFGLVTMLVLLGLLVVFSGPISHKFFVYAFGVPTDLTIENFNFEPNTSSEKKVSFNSMLELPGLEDLEVDISHLNSYPPITNLGDYDLQDFEEGYYFSEIRLWSYWPIEKLEVENIIDGEVWEPSLQAIYYINGSSVDTFNPIEVLDEDFTLNPNYKPKYGYAYFLAYPIPSTSSFFKSNSFAEGAQRIHIEYVDAMGKSQDVFYELKLEWAFYYDLISAWVYSIPGW